MNVCFVILKYLNYNDSTRLDLGSYLYSAGPIWVHNYLHDLQE